jgi:WD40 repeat protein
MDNNSSRPSQSRLLSIPLRHSLLHKPVLTVAKSIFQLADQEKSKRSAAAANYNPNLYCNIHNNEDEDEVNEGSGSYYPYLSRVNELRSSRRRSKNVSSTSQQLASNIWSKWQAMKTDANNKKSKKNKAKYYDSESDDEEEEEQASRHPNKFQEGLDFLAAGKELAAKLHNEGQELTHNHLDVINNLDGLERIWIDYGGKIGLNEQEFVLFLSSVLSLPGSELSILFQKMDANSDGSLSFDEYLSYLIRELSHNWQFSSGRGQYILNELDTPPISIHNNSHQITQILAVPKESNHNPGKYIFLSKDNTISVYNSNNMTALATLPNPNKHRYVASATSANILSVPHVALEYSNLTKQVFVADLDKKIHLYQQAYRQFIHIDHINTPDTPHSLALFNNNLFVGDTNGSVHIYNINHNNSNSNNHSSNPSSSLSSHELLSSVSIHHRSESVCRIQYINNVGLLTCSLDGSLTLSDLNNNCQLLRQLTGHRRGVYCFASGVEQRMIVSAGFDGRILIHDPFLSQPTSILPIVHNNILDIFLNESKNQLITVCSDKKVRLFDIRSLKVIQSLVDSTEYSPNDLFSAAAFDYEQQQLITASNKIRIWPTQIAPNNRTRQSGAPAHNNLIVAICYSQIFQQLVSVSVDETVHVWSLFSAKSVFEFRCSHNNSPITAACLDHKGKRLITASHDGAVKCFNFSNGSLMHEFKSIHREISYLLYLPRSLQCLVGLSWDKNLIRWPHSSNSGNHKANSSILDTSKDNEYNINNKILSVGYYGNQLTTGGLNGEIISWYMDSNRLNKRFHIKTNPNSNKNPNITKIYYYQSTSANIVYLILGCDDGSLLVYNSATLELLYENWSCVTEAVNGIAINAAGNRLVIIDCQSDCKLFRIAPTTTLALELSLINSFDPHSSGTITSLLYIDCIEAFVTSSDRGEMFLFSMMSGELLCKYAQTKVWPIVDNRSAIHSKMQQSLHANDDSDEEIDYKEKMKQQPSSSNEAGSKAAALQYIEQHPPLHFKSYNVTNVIKEEKSHNNKLSSSAAHQFSGYKKLHLNDLFNKLEVEMKVANEKNHKKCSSIPPLLYRQASTNSTLTAGSSSHRRSQFSVEKL